MPLQWRNQIWQSLEEGARKRCSECGRETIFGGEPQQHAVQLCGRQSQKGESVVSPPEADCICIYSV